MAAGAAPDYWQIMSNPFALADSIAESAHDRPPSPAWPEGVLFDLPDLEAPPQLVWLLGLPAAQFNSLLSCAGFGAILPHLCQVIDRGTRERAKAALGESLFSLSQSGIKIVPPDSLALESVNLGEILARSFSPRVIGCRLVVEAVGQYGAAWLAVLRLKLGSHDSSANVLPNADIALSRLVWLHDYVSKLAMSRAIGVALANFDGGSNEAR